MSMNSVDLTNLLNLTACQYVKGEIMLRGLGSNGNEGVLHTPQITKT